MSIRAGRDLDMAGVLGRHSNTSGILGLFFAIIKPLSVPILPENAVIVQKPPENAAAARKSPENAVGVRFPPED